MSIGDKFSIIVLVLLIVVQLVNRGFLSKYLKFSSILAVVIMFGFAFYSTSLQYEVWKANPTSSFLLPPHTSPFYFALYAISRFFSPLLAALTAAITLKILSEFLNKRFDERFFEPEESWLFAIGVFLTGYPGFIFYIPVMLVAALFISIFYSVLRKEKAPLFYLWLPVAVFAILLTSYIPQSFLNNFII